MISVSAICKWAARVGVGAGEAGLNQLRWYAGCCLVALPFGALATTSSNPWVFIGGLEVFLIFMSSLPACSNAALNLVTPNEMRGAGIAFFGTTAGLIGLSLGPIMIAGFSDFAFGGNSIGYGLAATMGVCCPLAALLLGLGCRGMRDAMAEAEKWSGNN